MDKDILQALSNLLDEKLKPITQELTNINKKLDGITEQTADLVEFRSEMIKKVDGIRDDLSTVELVTAKNYKDIVNLKAVK
ncbi:plasmid stabilization protein (plasmid) [Clostridium septicum]|uniref:plasmid stabilization protein n=1 Tax=Clostridium septicum TaxID=1504 RepID=UPI00272DCC9E|nr:plasmid stabilization protein [Clostridium septicum]WLF71109.1 plasmid stabilization protein [Clostridium septicum]